ncbi:MAG: ATP-binding protein [Alphaproteobacteria bacterium]
MKLIGRSVEKEVLRDLLNSDNPEFLAIYGRRRVGKTYLVREYFSNSKKALFFNITGSKNGKLSSQIEHFTDEIGKVFYGGANLSPGKNWDKTFKILTTAIDNLPKNQKIVLFFDEFPWMATKNSRVLTTLDYYWNQYWSRNKRIKLIICGSSASWIVDKILNNKGGLHNRLTRSPMRLLPLNLEETKKFLKSQEIDMTPAQITQLYMVTGGIPYYLTHVKKGLSVAQNIDLLAFKKDGLLTREFDNLYSSLFDNHDIYVDLIRLIAEHKYGLGQEEILKKIWGNTKGEGGIKKLKELQDTGFIMRFKPYLHKKKGIYYKIIDEYTLFYLDWIEPVRDGLLHSKLSQGYWERQQDSPKWRVWSGYAFESICYKHIDKIQTSLNIDATALPSTWRATSPQEYEKGAQIDLLFDRTDDSITLCEIKFTRQPFGIDKAYAEELENKIKVFKEITRTRKQIFLSIISASGLKKSRYSQELVSGVVTLDDLF